MSEGFRTVLPAREQEILHLAWALMAIALSRPIGSSTNTIDLFEMGKGRTKGHDEQLCLIMNLGRLETGIRGPFISAALKVANIIGDAMPGIDQLEEEHIDKIISALNTDLLIRNAMSDQEAAGDTTLN